MEYTIEDDFNTSAAHYWEVFFSEEYNAALWPHLDIDWELLEFDRKGEGESLVITRKARLTPKRDVPRFLQAMLSTTVSYVEHNRYVAAQNRMDTRIEPNYMADRIDNRGVYRLEEKGQSTVRRIWTGTCIAKVAFVGSRVEQFLVDQIKESYAKTTAFTRTWLAKHPAS